MIYRRSPFLASCIGASIRRRTARRSPLASWRFPPVDLPALRPSAGAPERPRLHFQLRFVGGESEVALGARRQKGCSSWRGPGHFSFSGGIDVTLNGLNPLG